MYNEIDFTAYVIPTATDKKSTIAPNYEGTKKNVAKDASNKMDKFYNSISNVVNFVEHLYMPEDVRNSVKENLPTVIDGLNTYKNILKMVYTADMKGTREMRVKRNEEERKREALMKTLKSFGMSTEEAISMLSKAA